MTAHKQSLVFRRKLASWKVKYVTLSVMSRDETVVLL